MMARFSSSLYLSLQPETHVTRKGWMSFAKSGEVEVRIRRDDQGPVFRFGLLVKGGMLLDEKKFVSLRAVSSNE